MTGNSTSGWLRSREWDLTFLHLPGWVALGLALSVAGKADVSPLAFLILVVGIDVAHVYSTLYRSYLRPSAWRDNRRLLWMLPTLATISCITLHAVSPAWFWTGMAYLAAFHFVRQQAGFSMLYRRQEGLSTRDGDARAERGCVYALTVFPLWWWHVHLPREFAWFLPGDFQEGLPEWTLLPAGMVALGAVGHHLYRRWRSRRWSPGRDAWMVLTGATWMGGICLSQGDLAFTLSNVVLHGIAYLALVWHTTQREWARTGKGPLWRWWFQPASFALFLAPLLLLAFVEEGVWDRLVWGDHPGLFGEGGGGGSPDWALVPLLAVPQVTHYLLDGYLWRSPR